MSAPYDIEAVTVVAYGRLALRFADGTEGEVTVLDRMQGPVFAEARTPEGFLQVSVDPDTRTVTWPGGADLAPDVLHRAVTDGVEIVAAREALGREAASSTRAA